MNNIFQMINQVRNPQELLNQMMNNNQVMKNPIAKNTFDMMKRGDTVGLEQTCRNLYKEMGMDPDKVLEQFKNQFGMK